MYQERDLVRIAKRENNKKRKYLVVNRLQGKHIPVIPGDALQMFGALAEICKKEYQKERVLVIGFAETATAIGATVAIAMEAPYIQTTRETLPEAEYLFFSEEHSHATQQKLVKNMLDRAVSEIDRILFVEDEVTTGKTIWNIVTLLKERYPGRLDFSVASLLNGMESTASDFYEKQGIRFHYLVKTDHKEYTKEAEGYKENGTYISCEAEEIQKMEERTIPFFMDPRRMVKGAAYQESCRKLWREVKEMVPIERDMRVLVLGTEEFMYPALYVAGQMQKCDMDVRFHATTRSPIAVSSAPGYPLHTRYELGSLYEKERVTYLYDLGRYDYVLILTDAKSKGKEGIASLSHALRKAGNQNIMLVRWCEK